jgi:type IV pilus assembly protein PilB
MEPIKVGEYLVWRGIISEKDVEKILSHSKQTGLKFCEAALKLEIVSQKALIHAFAPRFEGDYFRLSSAKFPDACRDLLDVNFVIKNGVLPLGFKSDKKLFRTRKILNIGLLDPSRVDVVNEVLALAQRKFGVDEVQSAKVYLIFVDQFLDVLGNIYKVSEDDMLNRRPDQLDEMLKLFLYTQEQAQAA